MFCNSNIGFTIQCYSCLNVKKRITNKKILVLIFACWIGSKSTKGDLFYFNNAKISMGKLLVKRFGFYLSSLLAIVFYLFTLILGSINSEFSSIIVSSKYSITTLFCSNFVIKYFVKFSISILSVFSSKGNFG